MIPYLTFKLFKVKYFKLFLPNLIFSLGYNKITFVKLFCSCLLSQVILRNCSITLLFSDDHPLKTMHQSWDPFKISKPWVRSNSKSLFPVSWCWARGNQKGNVQGWNCTKNQKVFENLKKVSIQMGQTKGKSHVWLDGITRWKSLGY